MVHLQLQAWFMDDIQNDPQLPHHLNNPHEFVSPNYLAGIRFRFI